MKDKINVIFVCLGNICRSPMAEFLFKKMTKSKGYVISSAATSYEEEGSPLHYGTRRILDRLGIEYSGFSAHRLTKAECDNADYLIGMEQSNLSGIKRICGRENEYKVHRLLDFTDFPHDIADPWYTHDFDTTYREISLGLTAFLKATEGEK